MLVRNEQDPKVEGNNRANHHPSVATRSRIPRTWSMREETFTTTRYSPTLRREVGVRLTYSVGEGPRPDIVRWFLVREDVLEVQDHQTPALQLEESMEAHPQDVAQR